MALVRQFDGDGRIELAAGQLGSVLGGAWTVVAVALTDTLDNWQTLLSLEQAGPTSVYSVEIAASGGGELFVYVDGLESYGPTVAANTWMLVAISKPAGLAAPRMHVYRYDTDTWVHGDGDGEVDNSSELVTSVTIGAWEETNDPWEGRIAAIGVWGTALTDQQVEALTGRLRDWLSSSPVAAWYLGDDPVADLTGNGADETSSAGTAVVDDPSLPFDTSLDPGQEVTLAGATTTAATAAAAAAVARPLVGTSPAVAAAGGGIARIRPLHASTPAAAATAARLVRQRQLTSIVQAAAASIGQLAIDTTREVLFAGTSAATVTKTGHVTLDRHLTGQASVAAAAAGSLASDSIIPGVLTPTGAMPILGTSGTAPALSASGTMSILATGGGP